MTRTLHAALVAFAFVALAPFVVHAQVQPGSADATAATTLFYEARSLMAAGRWVEACPKLEESLRLDEGIGTRFNLADCHEHIGKLATAWTGFVDTAARARAAGQVERERVARARAKALEPRLPKLVIEVPAPDKDVEIRRDGVPVGSAVWGTPVPVDPGPHTVSAHAPGKLPWQTTVHATEGAIVRTIVPRTTPSNATVVTPVAPPPAASPAAPAPPPVTPAPVTPAPVTPPAPQPTVGPEPVPPMSDAEAILPAPEGSRSSRGTVQRAVGFVASGLGLVGLGVGGYFGLRSLDKRDDASAHCNGDLCDATGVDLRQDAIRAGNIATGVSIGAGAALAGGLLLVLTAPRGTDRTGWHAAPRIGAGGAGLVVGGSFQ